MGLNHCPAIRDYFSKDEVFENEFIKKIMKSERKFFNINQQIHFDLDYIIFKLNQNFKKFYKPTETLVIDETLILFKGRFTRKQYVPKKPHNTGLKFYSFCDSNKYLYDFWFFKGKKKNQEKKGKSNLQNSQYSNDFGSIDTLSEPSNIPSDIVEKFVNILPEPEKRLILADNYYGSLDLGEKLSKRDVYYIFTCNKNRPGFLFKNMDQGLKKKKFRFFCKGNILALSFFDTGICNFLSNCCDTIIMLQNEKKKPQICVRYNNSMGYVDSFNYHLGVYLYKHRKSKWTK